MPTATWSPLPPLTRTCAFRRTLRAPAWRAEERAARRPQPTGTSRHRPRPRMAWQVRQEVRRPPPRARVTSPQPPRRPRPPHMLGQRRRGGRLRRRPRGRCRCRCCCLYCRYRCCPRHGGRPQRLVFLLRRRACPSGGASGGAKPASNNGPSGSGSCSLSGGGAGGSTKPQVAAASRGAPTEEGPRGAARARMRRPCVGAVTAAATG